MISDGGDDVHMQKQWKLEFMTPSNANAQCFPSFSITVSYVFGDHPEFSQPLTTRKKRKKQKAGTAVDFWFFSGMSVIMVFFPIPQPHPQPGRMSDRPLEGPDTHRGSKPWLPFIVTQPSLVKSSRRRQRSRVSFCCSSY